MKAKDDLIQPIILAGGKGSRLWPMSRSARPKQFLSLTDDISLFQQTLLRLQNLTIYKPPLVITNSEYRFIVAEQALECEVELGTIVLEPVARNTAAAIAAASFLVSSEEKSQLAHVLASDHVIEVDDAYLDALNIAKTSAQSGRLATFGISPDGPATEYGYIEARKHQENDALEVIRFVEKPNKERAREMIESGNYYWNSGMFLFTCDVFLKECRTHAPQVYSAAKSSVERATKDLDFIRLDPDSFAKSPNISVDYAVFENTTLASVVPSLFNWSDLGSWDAVWKVGKRDKADNLARGNVTLNDTTGSVVISEKQHLVVNGLDDVIAIATQDAVYMGRLSDAQSVGSIVEKLKSKSDTAPLTENHQTSYRPWGGYSSMEIGNRFQVKRIFVKPGKRLSLQKHHHRSEHWIIVAGTAEVELGEKKMILRENESVYIPQGELHRLHNPGKILLELIEVQTGSYFGEDDIIRIEDEFGRT